MTVVGTFGMSLKSAYRTGPAMRGAVAAGALGLLLAGCQVDGSAYGPKHLQPLGYAIKAEMERKGMTAADPVLVRLFKEESELEIWKRTENGKYDLLKTYEICKWSGDLGPKFKEGDRQAPEGFYTIRPAQMNPKSSYHLSFNLGFPNAYDRSHGRTGSHLMVHGACSSRGCYAMEDEQIQEIYSLARESFRGGQRDFQVEAYPFRMTPENMARHADSEHMAFWKMIKEGYDHFEVTRLVPKVDVCGKKYVFNAELEDKGERFVADRQCPAYSVPEPIARAVAAKEQRDEVKLATLITEAKEKKEREERWKNGETPLAKIFNGGSVAASETAEGQPADVSLSYAGTPAPDAPVPQRNPARPLELKSSSDKTGFFSGLFKRETPPEAPQPDGAATLPASTGSNPDAAPAVPPLPPQANAASATSETPAAPDTSSADLPATQAQPQTSPDAVPNSVPGAVPVPQAAPRAAAEPEKGNLSAVSDVVSRWFGGSKKSD